MLTSSAVINATTAIGIDDNSAINPTILITDLMTLTLKCLVILLSFSTI